MAFMNFGKHRGTAVEDVPTQYLQWCLRECECLDSWLREAIRQELRERVARVRERQQDCRQQPGPRSAPPADWSGLIQRWYRSLVMDYHPDRSGDTKVMQALNDAHDRLKRLVGV